MTWKRKKKEKEKKPCTKKAEIRQEPARGAGERVEYFGGKGRGEDLSRWHRRPPSQRKKEKKGLD